MKRENIGYAQNASELVYFCPLIGTPFYEIAIVSFSIVLLEFAIFFRNIKEGDCNFL